MLLFYSTLSLVSIFNFSIPVFILIVVSFLRSLISFFFSSLPNIYLQHSHTI
jgi:hypothetical protein